MHRLDDDDAVCRPSFWQGLACEGRERDQADRNCVADYAKAQQSEVPPTLSTGILREKGSPATVAAEVHGARESAANIRISPASRDRPYPRRASDWDCLRL